VLAADQPQLHLAAADLPREQLLEGERRVDASEAAAEDEDARGLLAHHDASGELDTGAGRPDAEARSRSAASATWSAGSTDVRWTRVHRAPPVETAAV